MSIGSDQDQKAVNTMYITQYAFVHVAIDSNNLEIYVSSDGVALLWERFCGLLTKKAMSNSCKISPNKTSGEYAVSHLLENMQLVTFWRICS
jgi:hypothetical protein